MKSNEKKMKSKDGWEHLMVALRRDWRWWQESGDGGGSYGCWGGGDGGGSCAAWGQKSRDRAWRLGLGLGGWGLGWLPGGSGGGELLLPVAKWIGRRVSRVGEGKRKRWEGKERKSGDEGACWQQQKRVGKWAAVSRR